MSNQPKYAFLGWVLSFEYSDDDKKTITQLSWKPNQMALLSSDEKSIFLSTMNVKKNKKYLKPSKMIIDLFNKWSQSSVDSVWTASINDVPEINKKMTPWIITYWSDKYEAKKNGHVYKHFFDQWREKMGINKKQNAIFISNVKVTKRGIE
jgi:hypothetical protein